MATSESGRNLQGCSTNGWIAYPGFGNSGLECAIPLGLTSFGVDKTLRHASIPKVDPNLRFPDSIANLLAELHALFG